jgi:hypothetical protein
MRIRIYNTGLYNTNLSKSADPLHSLFSFFAITAKLLVALVYYCVIRTARERLLEDRERIVGERERIMGERERIVGERERIAAKRERLVGEKERRMAKKGLEQVPI